jgi:hypothetical protein
MYQAWQPIPKLLLPKVKDWINTDFTRSAWVVFRIHGIGKDTGFDPVSPDTFLALLDKLEEAQDNNDLWVAPFADVGAYWRATDIFEQSKFADHGNGGAYHWDISSVTLQLVTRCRMHQ